MSARDADQIIGSPVKISAPSTDEGVIAIAWQLEDGNRSERSFGMHWSEQGGPRVETPTRCGFGSTVIDRLLAASLEREVDLDWHPTGVVCRIQADRN